MDVRRRVAALEPDGYTRTGAALRHTSALLARQPARRRGLPRTVCAFALVGIDGLAQIGLGRLLLGSFPLQPVELLGLAARGLVTAPLAPSAAALSRRLRESLDETEARRDMRLDTRRPVLR